VNAWRVKDWMPEFRKYEIRFGKNQILIMLHLAEVIDQHNNVSKKYQDLKLFQHQEIDIINDRGKNVNSYKTLFLTKKGFHFVVRHLKKYPNIRLSKELKEFLMKYRVTAVKKKRGR
jgi:hypothetical protein